MKKLKSLFVYALILAVFLVPCQGALAIDSQMSSSGYKMEAINFGQDVVLYSTQESIEPIISGDGPQVSNVKATSATITWNTDKSSNSIVHFGVTSSYGSQQGNYTTLVKEHLVDLANLSPSTTYHYKISSEDRAGNIGESADATFTTPKQPAISTVAISDITMTSAIVSFETSTIVHAILNYGTTTDYGSTVTESSGSLTTNHTLRLDNLAQGVTYNTKITGADEYGKEIASDNYVFSTLPKPSILDIKVTDATANSVVVRWTTNTETDSMVEYYTNSEVLVEGLEKSAKQTQGATDRVKEHQIKLIKLLGNTVYYFRISSQDAYSNRAESSENSFATSADAVAPEILTVKTESSLGANGDSTKVQVTVTWETDELSTSQVKYDVGSAETGSEETTTENAILTTFHYVILTGLKPSATYHVKAVSSDPSKNTGESKLYTLLTPKKRRSLLQLIAEKLEETFGWIKKLKILN